MLSDQKIVHMSRDPCPVTLVVPTNPVQIQDIFLHSPIGNARQFEIIKAESILCTFLLCTSNCRNTGHVGFCDGQK
jgi:hypothetical protein